MKTWPPPTLKSWFPNCDSTGRNIRNSEADLPPLVRRDYEEELSALLPVEPTPQPIGRDDRGIYDLAQLPEMESHIRPRPIEECWWRFEPDWEGNPYDRPPAPGEAAPEGCMGGGMWKRSTTGRGR